MANKRWQTFNKCQQFFFLFLSLHNILELGNGVYSTKAFKNKLHRKGDVLFRRIQSSFNKLKIIEECLN